MMSNIFKDYVTDIIRCASTVRFKIYKNQHIVWIFASQVAQIPADHFGT
jgi:hypothetical protein